jgi:hypothetical protein
MKEKIKKAQQKYFLVTTLAFVFLLSGLFFSVALAVDLPPTTVIPGLVAAPASQPEVQGPASSTPGPIYTPPATYGPQPAPNNGAVINGMSPVNQNNGAVINGMSPVKSNGASAGGGVVIPTTTGLSDRSIKDILTNLLNWLLMIVGIIALIGFIISGIQYILAAGDEKLMELGKKNMLYSIMGIVVVMASLVVVQAIDYALRAQSMF